MKSSGLLLAVAAVLCLERSDPSELELRTAFESALNNPLHGVVIASSDSGAGMLLRGDRTEIHSLRKLGCVRAPVSAFVCDFFVDLRAGDEIIRRIVSGYFLDGPGALTFAREVREGDVGDWPLVRSAQSPGGPAA